LLEVVDQVLIVKEKYQRDEIIMQEKHYEILHGELLCILIILKIFMIIINIDENIIFHVWLLFEGSYSKQYM